MRVPLTRAEEARAEWLERFPEGFEERAEGDELELAAYVDGDAPPDLRAEDVEPGWEERWREFHRPVRVGPFWIGPPWETPDAASVPIVIDPGRAFGTGAHPTTRLCVELVAELSPASLLDVGTGSGIVAIAAAKLGASPVHAVDVDPAAVEVARANVEANGVELDVREADAVTDLLPNAQVAAVNISAGLVERVVPRLDAAVVVASGYLERDEPELAPFVRRERRVLDGWAADLLERGQ